MAASGVEWAFLIFHAYVCGLRQKHLENVATFHGCGVIKFHFSNRIKGWIFPAPTLYWIVYMKRRKIPEGPCATPTAMLRLFMELMENCRLQAKLARIRTPWQKTQPCFKHGIKCPAGWALALLPDNHKRPIPLAGLFCIHPRPTGARYRKPRPREGKRSGLGPAD